jgi:hypothetical protein
VVLRRTRRLAEALAQPSAPLVKPPVRLRATAQSRTRVAWKGFCQFIGALSSLGRRLLTTSPHSWEAIFENDASDARGFSDETRLRVGVALASYGPITGAERGEVARILLSARGADARMQLMLIGYWTASYLMMAAWLLAPCFAIAVTFRSSRWQLLLAAGAAVLVGSVFRLRAKQYMHAAVAAAVYGVLALSSTPDWARDDA